jgi:hypothetical protein
MGFGEFSQNEHELLRRYYRIRYCYRGSKLLRCRKCGAFVSRDRREVDVGVVDPVEDVSEDGRREGEADLHQLRVGVGPSGFGDTCYRRSGVPAIPDMLNASVDQTLSGDFAIRSRPRARA